MKRKLFAILIILTLVLFAACGGDDTSAIPESDPDPIEDTETIEVEADVELPENFPVLPDAVLARYFDIAGMYQYTFHYEGSASDMREYLIPNLYEVGILASGGSQSQFAGGSAEDIAMSSGDEEPFLGYIILHPDGASDYGDIKGYTLIVGDSIFNYQPYEHPVLQEEVAEPTELSILPGSVLYEYQDRRDLFQNDELFRYFYKIDYFSGETVNGGVKELWEVYEFYVNDLVERGFEVQDDNVILAQKDDISIRVAISPFYVGGSMHGAYIEIIK